MLKNWMWLLLLTFSISPALIGCSNDADRTDAVTGDDAPAVEESEEFIEGEIAAEQAAN
tara:strand:+ start:6682 stop:6858 length:177 start_codon:yes stop_codon:yes gene_type:complete